MDQSGSSSGAQGADHGAQPSRFTYRRNSSTMFQSLMNEKRATDPAAVARRQSFSDQRPNAGFLGQMWFNYTRGTGNSK